MCFKYVYRNIETLSKKNRNRLLNLQINDDIFETI